MAAPPEGYTVKLVAVTVSGSMRLLNVNWITLVVATAVAPFAGLTLVTLGGVRSAPAPILKEAKAESAKLQ
jgi:hypothetical protein